MLEKEENLKKQSELLDGELCAKYFKYFSQFNKSYLEFNLPFEKVRSKSFYQSNKNSFDKLAIVFSKYNIDAIDYIRFAVTILKLQDFDVKSKLVDFNTILKYVDYLLIKEKRRKVFKQFMLSVDKISTECAKLNYPHVVDYLRMLISTKKLAVMYVTGLFSKYWLSAIPKFNLVIAKLDRMSLNDFMHIYNMYDTYSREIYEAMNSEIGHPIRVFEYTDKQIHKKIQQSLRQV